MDAIAILDSYVSAVIRHLPRRQRNDVGFELRSLLAEELEGRAADAGRAPDAALARELLVAFGAPQDVADRYRPAGFTVIRPADAPRFARIALIGVAAQWAITLPAALLAAAPFDAPALVSGDWLNRLAAWWLSWGLGSFWWPGFLVTLALIAGAFGARREARTEGREAPVSLRQIDPDQVRRPVLVLGLGLAALGASLVIALPTLASWAPGLPQPLLDALALDPDFLRWRAWGALVLWAAHFALYVAVLIAGRWSALTQRLAIALNLGWAVLMVGWLIGGPIMTQTDADAVAKFCLALIAVIALVDMAVTIRRRNTTPRAPAS